LPDNSNAPGFEDRLNQIREIMLDSIGQNMSIYLFRGVYYSKVAPFNLHIYFRCTNNIGSVHNQTQVRPHEETKITVFITRLTGSGTIKLENNCSASCKLFQQRLNLLNCLWCREHYETKRGVLTHINIAQNGRGEIPRRADHQENLNLSLVAPY